ncbi:MAG TPA: hypothetical protein PKW37_00015 [Salinivirgaceae bacterium]|nr:hypothetical protein [Salinivirgaceae bacterium]
MKNLILLFAIFSLVACNKETNCRDKLPKQIIGTGEIVSNALVSRPLTTWAMSNYEHVIRTDSQNVFSLKVSFDNGNTYDSIDFNQYTLLGKYASEACRATFERNVTKDDSQKKYLYKITVHQCGLCDVLCESMNWVLVPKIPDDYDVSFSVETKKY